jgi:hypothetical protein
MILMFIGMVVMVLIAPIAILTTEARKGNKVLTALVGVIATIVLFSPVGFLFVTPTTFTALFFLISVIACPLIATFGASHLLERIEDRHFNRK